MNLQVGENSGGR